MSISMREFSVATTREPNGLFWNVVMSRNGIRLRTTTKDRPGTEKLKSLAREIMCAPKTTPCRGSAKAAT